MANLRWAWSDRTHQSMSGFHPADKPAYGDGYWVATVARYDGSEHRCTINRLGAAQPLTGTYATFDDGIAAVEAWLDQHPEHLARHDASRRKY